MTLTDKQRALLIGGLLGDLHIQKTPSNSGKCRLRFCHSIKQKDYVDYKYRVFKEDLCSTTKEPYVESKKRDTNYLFYTSYSLSFAEPYQAWYEADSKDGAPFAKIHFGAC